MRKRSRFSLSTGQTLGSGRSGADNIVTVTRFAQQQAAALMRVTGRAVGANLCVKVRGQL